MWIYQRLLPMQPLYTTADANWMDKFKEAYEGGKHHGDYFILSNDITIDTEEAEKIVTVSDAVNAIRRATEG